MLSLKSYIESDKLLQQVGEMRPGFLDKDTSLFKGPFRENLNGDKFDLDKPDASNSFQLVETKKTETGEIFIDVYNNKK